MKVLMLAVFCGVCACALANYQSLDGSGLQESLASTQRLNHYRLVLRDGLQTIEKIATQREDIQEAVADRIAELRAQVERSIGLPLRQAEQSLAEIGQGLSRLFQLVIQKLRTTVENRLQRLQPSQGQIQQLREQVEQQLEQLESQVGQIFALQREFGQRVSQLRNQQQALSQQSGNQAVQELLALQQNIQSLYTTVIQRLDGGLDYSAQLNPQETQDLVDQLRANIERQLQLLETRVAQNSAIRAQYGQQISVLRSQQQSLSQLTGSEALGGISALYTRTQKVYYAVQRYLMENGNYAQDQGEQSRQSQLLQQLRNQVEQQLEQLEAQVAQSVALQGQFGDQVSDLRSQQEDLSQESGRRAIQSYIYLQGIIRQISRAVTERIEGGLDYSSLNQQQLRLQIQSELQQLEDLVYKSVLLKREYGQRVSALRSQQQQSSSLDLQELLSLQSLVQQTYIEVIERIEGGLD